jgi:hypothetical protein
MPGPPAGSHVVLSSRRWLTAVCTGSLTSEGEAPCESAHFSSFGRSAVQSTRTTVSRCAWRRRSSGGSPTRTGASLGAKRAHLKDRGGPAGLRDASLWATRLPVRATRASSWLGRASSKLRDAWAWQRDASSWLTRASSRLARARAWQRDASSWLARASSKLDCTRASQRDASSCLARASSDLTRSRLSSPDASFRHAPTRERHGRASSRLRRASLGLARALLHAGCASSKLEDAREGEAAHFLEKSDRVP